MSDGPIMIEAGGGGLDGSTISDAPVNARDAAMMSDAAVDAGDGSLMSDAADDSPADAGPDTGCGCGSAELCADGSACVALNDVCAEAIDATPGGTWTGSVCNANDSENFSCSSPGLADVYFRLASAGDYLVSVTGGFTLAAFSECPRTAMPSLCISPFPSTLTTITALGETWLVLEPRGACGSYTIRVIPL
jgi:hypothetical protein